MIINFTNGTLCLREGEFSGSHRRELFQNIQFPYDFNRDAHCPNWDLFLESLEFDPDTLSRLQEWTGYCLLPMVQGNLQKSLFLVGEGANGKSVFLNAVTGLLADYSYIAPMETFTETHGERHPTELAALDGARLVVSQETEHGKGLGQLICIDASKKGDISKTGAIWSYKKIDRSISTVAIAGGLVFAADYAGTLHCLDAEKGTAFWTHDTGGNIWGSPLAADGKVFIGNEEGLLTILAATRKKKLLGQAEFDVEIYSSPIVANGVLYVSTQSHLFAVSKK